MQKKMYLAALLVVLALTIVGCASTGRLIDNAALQTRVVMTDAVFLDLTPKAKTAYIRVTNTSDLQGVMLAPLLRDRLLKRGFTLLDDPAAASYIIQPNITSFVARKEGSASQDVSIAGTIMGGVTGAALAGGRGDTLPFAMAGSIVGNVGGALLGSMFKVQSVAGTVDLQIQEKTDTPVIEVVRTDARQGTSTVVSTQQAVQSNYQTYRTKFQVEARRTNLNIDEAVARITDKLADQIAGLF
jgi:outer membrane lipoprotein SlyB